MQVVEKSLFLSYITITSFVICSQLYVVIYSQVFTYHESNGSTISIVVCLIIPVLDFRYSFHKNEVA